MGATIIAPRGFYVYTHLRPDTGEVFYVGKGSGGRAWEVAGRTEEWQEAAKTHWFAVRIEADDFDERMAYRRECETILFLKSQGARLVNKTIAARRNEGIEKPVAPRVSVGMSQKQIAEMVRRYSEGEGATELAKHFGCNRRFVYRKVDEVLGAACRNHPRKNPCDIACDEEEKEEAFLL